MASRLIPILFIHTGPLDLLAIKSRFAELGAFQKLHGFPVTKLPDPIAVTPIVFTQEEQEFMYERTTATDYRGREYETYAHSLSPFGYHCFFPKIFDRAEFPPEEYEVECVAAKAMAIASGQGPQTLATTIVGLFDGPPVSDNFERFKQRVHRIAEGLNVTVHDVVLAFVIDDEADPRATVPTSVFKPLAMLTVHSTYRVSITPTPETYYSVVKLDTRCYGILQAWLSTRSNVDPSGAGIPGLLSTKEFVGTMEVRKRYWDTTIKRFIKQHDKNKARRQSELSGVL